MNNKIKIILGILVLTFVTLGFVGITEAATYNFINTSGKLGTIVANNPQEAINQAYQLGAHSGVILVFTANSNQPNLGEGSFIYQYVNTSGSLITIRANSPKDAFAKAYELGIHSGVILVR